MAKKNLPVKMVRKRENDQLSNEGHGGKTTPPKWVLKGDELNSRADEFRQVFRQVGSRLREKVNQEGFQPAIIRVKLMSEAIAKNHRREISKLFNVQKKLNIIGLVGEDELILKIDSPEDLEAIEKRLKGHCQICNSLISY
jgi:transcriptional regulator of NAD metabolism